jgi:peptidyl-prolyl cis-trans isomerase D
MALIGTIRKNGWLLVGTMILALVAFILMTIMENQQNYSQGDANTVATVNGKTIRYEDFQNYKEVIYSNASNSNDLQINQTVYNYFMEDAIVRDIAGDLGFGVCRDELMDLQFGQRLSPIVQERYGQNLSQLAEIKGAIEGGQLEDPQYAPFRQRWAVQEKEIIKRRLQDKIQNLVAKSMFTPAWQAEMAFKETNEKKNFLFVRVPYDKVTDDQAPVTDADYKAYLAENPKLYNNEEETRILEFVSIDVVPTGADSMDCQKRLSDLASKLGKGDKEDSLYIVNNGGVWNPSFIPKAQLPPTAADQLAATPIGSTYGPYIDGDSYVVAKLLGKKLMPDSVRARHILIKPDQDPAASTKIDSLKKLIEGGASFEALARTNSSDGSAAKGGDLGYFANGRMVPEFNDVCFNTGEQGKIYKVQTQFGFHLIEITGKKFIKNETSIKAAFLIEPIRPSDKTVNEAKGKAELLVQSGKSLTDLATAAAQQGLQVQTSPALKINDIAIGILGNGADARQVIRWAFDADNDGEKAKVGNLAGRLFTFVDPGGRNFDSRYAIVGLKSISPAGAATAESLKSNATADLEVKNRKKAGVILSKLQGVSDLAGAAAAYGVAVDTSTNAVLLNAGLPKAGNEPRVVGAAFGLSNGTVSKPIVGRSGVYLVQPISDPAVGNAPDLTPFRRQVNSTNNTQIRQGFITGLRKNASIKDNRSKFF